MEKIKLTIPIFIISLVSIFGKILGYFRDFLISFRLGAGIYSDIFFIVNQFIHLFKLPLSDSHFNSAYIPFHTKLDNKQSKNFADHFSGSLIVVLLILSIPIILLLEIFMNPIMLMVAPGIPEGEYFSLLVLNGRIMLPYIFLVIIQSVIMARLNVDNKFFIVSLMPLLLNLTIVIILILNNTYKALLIQYLAYGIVFGGIIQLSILFLFSRKILNRNSFANIAKNFKSIIGFFKSYGPIFVTSFSNHLNTVIIFIFASFLSGAASYIYFATRVVSLPISIIIIPIITVLLPNLSKILVSNKFIEAFNLQQNVNRFTFLIILPLSIFLYTMSESIIEILFERGAFDENSTTNTSMILKILAISLPAITIRRILIPYFYAANKIYIPLNISMLQVICNLILLFILFKYFSLMGIALSMTITAWLCLIYSLFMYYSLNSNIVGDNNFWFYIRCFGINFIFFILIVISRNYIENYLFFNDFIKFFININIYIFYYIILIYLFFKKEFFLLKDVFFLLTKRGLLKK
jgi:putative peptidoglycan lipid II flippase